MLQKLPREILILISHFLDQIQPHSVIDLSCVNRDLLSLCTPLLQVRTLKLFVYDDREQLYEDILHYTQLLQCFSGFWAVRRLIIVTSDNGEVISEQMGQRRPLQQLQRPRISALEYKGHESEILKKYAQVPGPMKYKDTVCQKNHIWKPLAEFMLRLPLLESVFYSSYYQFPPCLLDSLHQRQSRCRLYITRFALWSLDPQGTTDPYEFALLSSPSLHGIATASLGTYGNTLGGSNPHWEHVYLNQALRYLVSGLTPQLKKLLVIGRAALGAPAIVYNPPPWIGFKAQPKHEHGGSLKFLEIGENVREVRQNRREDFEKWNQDTDLSVLKTLKIGPKSTLDAIVYMTTDCHFLSLTELSINFNPDWRHWHPSSYYSAASSFLLDLPALLSLDLNGWHTKMATGSILRHHGTSLQKLSLLPCRGETIPLEAFHQLSEYCPFLEELTIQTRRSRGDIQEVSKYKAIGVLPRLKALFLKLDASDLHLLNGYEDDDAEAGREPPEVRNDPSFNAFDQQYCESTVFHYYLHPRNGHIRDAFINAALDEDLAKSIFHTIRSGYNKDREDSCKLEFVEMKVVDAGQLSYDILGSEQGFHDVLLKLGRTHRVTWKGIGVLKIEVGDEEEQYTSRHRRLYLDERGLPRILPFALQIYQRVWPTKNKHWFDDWHSFPLALSAEDEIDWSKR